MTEQDLIFYDAVQAFDSGDISRLLGQALWSAFNEPHKDHLRIVEVLIAAGAEIEPDWNPMD